MKYLARKGCTRLSQIAILDKSHSCWSGAPRPYLRHFTPGVSPIPVKDGGRLVQRAGIKVAVTGEMEKARALDERPHGRYSGIRPRYESSPRMGHPHCIQFILRGR